MKDFDPNLEQQKLIDGHDGIYKVDAGAGTGKTFTITRRYAEILEKEEVEPEDILLLTFTHNAADEMKERIINRSGYEMKALRDAPISTFHSLAKKIVYSHGFDAPREIGIDEGVSGSIRMIDNEVLEKQEFKDFMEQFTREHPEHREFYMAVRDEASVLGVIKEVASRGVIPDENGWYRRTGKHLEGDEEELEQIFRSANRSGDGNNSRLKSRSYSKLRNKCLHPSEPDRDQLFNSNSLEGKYVNQVFNEDREQLKQFLHDVYYGYLKHCLSRNYLNFSFLLVIAFILLNEDGSLREELRFEYSMIDEFQDTNEIQMKIAMLLSKGNLCVVGDWKQSIYSFQYVEVENITEFEHRLKKYRDELNRDRKRIEYPVDNITKIDLKTNYRSTQDILDLSEETLTLKGSSKEEIDESIESEITSLEAEEEGESRIEGFKSENQVEAVLSKIQEIVDNPEYEVDGRKPGYSDIAVLSRGKKFGLELQEKASDYSIPVAYEGGVELFNSRPGKLLLAWMRILDYSESKKGWSVVLEQAGYTMDEIDRITDNKNYSEVDYPQEMRKFREELEQAETVSEVARKVFERYGIEDAYTDRIIEVMQQTFDSSYMNWSDITGFIEECIAEQAEYDVDSSTSEESVVSQTIHKAKGLEYPIVIVADVTSSRFPMRDRGGPVISYDDTLGLRQSKIYSPDRKYVYDSWKTFLLNRALPTDYSEERRLMYVATTRAENHLIFSTLSGRESQFIQELEDLEEHGVEVEEYEPEIETENTGTENLAELEVEEPEKKAPVKRSVHAVLDLEEDTEGRGKEFGKKLHEFAEKYADGENVEPSNEDEEKVKQLIDSLQGELRTEVPIKVPTEEDGRKIVYHGVIDLLHITDDKVEIIDWKTDEEETNKEEYQKQLEIYREGIEEIFGSREVEARLFFSSIH